MYRAAGVPTRWGDRAMALIVRGRRFAPRWRWLAVALGGMILFVALGNWQLRRADERRALAAAQRAALAAPATPLPGTPVDASTYAMRRIQLRGTFLPAYTIYLDNRVWHGRVGYEIVTPLRLAGSALHVAVLRGWVAGTGNRAELPGVRTPSGEQVIDGLALADIPQRFEPSGAVPEGRVWQNFSVERYRASTSLALQPLILEQRSDDGDGLARDWPPHGAGAEKNENYALQWYSLAALSIILWIVLSFRRHAPAA